MPLVQGSVAVSAILAGFDEQRRQGGREVTRQGLGGLYVCA
jgi:hypothetical protein